MFPSEKSVPNLKAIDPIYHFCFQLINATNSDTLFKCSYLKTTPACLWLLKRTIFRWFSHSTSYKHIVTQNSEAPLLNEGGSRPLGHEN